MRFSIIVPIYNSALYLDACISSVKSQSFSDWELVAVDDGSVDESAKMLDEYAAADTRIKVIRQKNAGQFFARQTGINAARGDYILFLDSDDELEPHCLETVASELCAKASDIVLFTATAVTDDERNGKSIGKVFNEKRAISCDWLKEQLISKSTLNSLCLKAFRRSLFFGDDTDYTAFYGRHCGEDKARQLYPLTNAENAVFIPDALYRYNYRSDSVMHEYKLQNAELMMAEEMFSLLLTFMKRWGMDDEKHMTAYWAQYLRNFITVYYNVRKGCKLCGGYAEFRRYPWRKLPKKAALESRGRRLLTARERFKLIQALTLKR